MAYGDPTGVNKILVEKYGYEWVNGKAWRPGTAPEPEPIPEEEPVAATPPEPSQPAETPIEEPSTSGPISLEEKIEQLQASLNELQKKYEEALEKLEQANAKIAELEAQQSDASSDVSDADDTAVEPPDTPQTPEPQQPAETDAVEAVTPETPGVTAPETGPTPQPSFPEPTGVNKILVEKYGYEWVNGKAWKPGTAPEPETSNSKEEVGNVSGFEKQTLDVSDTADWFSVMMVNTADYDFDGDQDFIISHGSYPPQERQSFVPFSLINNHGVLERKAISGEPPLMTHGREGTFADFNNDGFLDYILVGHGWDTSPFPGEKNALFFGTIDGFIDKSALLPDYLDFTHSVAVGDLNGDGFNDIYIGNTYGENRVNPYLLLNTGNESFTEIELNDENFNIFSQKYLAAEIVDIDGDGVEELIVGAHDYPDGNRIFQYDAEEQSMVLEQVLPDNLFEVSQVMDIKVADLNDDGLLDIAILSTPSYSGAGLQVLFQDQDGSFSDVTNSVLPEFDQDQHWIEYIEIADADSDGDLDIMVSQTSARGANAYYNDNGVFVPQNADFKLDGFREWYKVSLDQITGEQYAAQVANGYLIVDQIII